MSKPKQVTVSTTVPVSQNEAWKAFTDPRAITQWNFASDDWCCPEAEVDLRVGGRHKARMEARDGSMGFDFEGVYEIVKQPESISLVLDDGRKSRTTFKPVGDGTLVTTIFDPDNEAPLKMQREGWQAILDNYQRFITGDG